MYLFYISLGFNNLKANYALTQLFLGHQRRFIVDKSELGSADTSKVPHE